jgi:hypothetical protein
MPLFRGIGYWVMERGVDSLTLVVLMSVVPVLPLILGVGLFYELFRALDARKALSDRTYWALATVATGLLILLAALFLFGAG